MSTNQPRKPAGTPTGGQWAPAAHAEPDCPPLAPPDVRPALVAEVHAHPRDADPRLIWGATPDEVDYLLDNGTSTHLVSLADRDDLTREHYLRLVEPQMPFAVRIGVATKAVVPGLAERASHDPHPVVRAVALYYGWDLSDGRRRALEADPGVARVWARLRLGGAPCAPAKA